jgi:hypothetical protein
MLLMVTLLVALVVSMMLGASLSLAPGRLGQAQSSVD